MNKLIPEINYGNNGLNDSSDSTWSQGDFSQDKYSSTLREYFQNSIDAFSKLKPNSKEKIIFKVKRAKLEYDFYNFNHLNNEIKSCIKTLQANNSGSAETAIKRFKKISKLCAKASSKKIESIIIEDNGIGLDGESRLSEGNLTTGWGRITGDDISDKGHGDLGSFGMGKSTAFSLADYLTVFYFSNFKNKNKFIGYTKLGMTYGKEGERRNYGPKSFFGRSDIDNEIEFADVADSNSISKNYRSIPNSGLTTIIPVNDFINRKEIKDFVDFTIHVLFHSFFSWFTQNKFEIEVFDEIEDKKLQINENNYRSIIEELGGSMIYEGENNIDFKYDYELVKTFILGKPIDTLDNNGEYEIKIKEEYEGKLKITTFENAEFNKYAEIKSKRSRGYLNKNFRIIREGMTIRSERYPFEINSRISPRFCGYLEYEGEFLIEVLNMLETASHDKFDYTRIQKECEEKPYYPKVSRIKSHFINKSSRELISLLKTLSTQTTSEDKAYKIMINTGNQESDNLGALEQKDSFYPSIKIERKEQKRIVPNLLNTVNTNGDGSLTEDENGEEKMEPEYKPGEREGGRGRRNKILVNSSRTGTINTYCLSTLIQKEGRDAKYLIQLPNTIGLEKGNLIIRQDSKIRNSVTSFIIESMEIRKKDSNRDDILKIQTWDHLQSNGFIAGYKIKDIDLSSYDKAFIEIEVKEPKITTSRFKISFETIKTKE